MSQPRQFAYTINGSHTTLVDQPSPYEAKIRRLLSLMDKDERSTFVLWRMPDGVHLFEVANRDSPDRFLQAAGSAEAMTIEWRRLDDDGEERLYVLGHGGPREGEPSVRIPFNDGDNYATVYPDEVFDAAEAGDIFFTYFETERIPDRYTLRWFDLDAPFEDQRGAAE